MNRRLLQGIIYYTFYGMRDEEKSYLSKYIKEKYIIFYIKKT